MNEEEAERVQAIWPFGKLTAVEMREIIQSLDFFVNTFPWMANAQSAERIDALRTKIEQMLDDFYNEC